MESKKEMWGNRIEIAGMAVVFAATVAQIQFTDWWDDQLRDWQALIQESVNLAELDSLSNLALMMNEPDADRRKKIADAIHDRTASAYAHAIKERDDRYRAKTTGQAVLFDTIKSSLLLFGSVLLAIGKVLTYVARKSSPSENA